MLKHCLLFITAAFCINVSMAQETVELRYKLSNNVTEVFHVLKNSVNTRQGLFQAIYKKKVPVASGMFDNDKKTGLWRFTDPNGQVLQTYDYSQKKVYFEAPEDTSSPLRYYVDLELKPTDKVTKPVKIGGRYYGYLPYLTLFTLPTGYKEIDRGIVDAVVVLLISPFGRLADYKVNLIAKGLSEPFKTVNMNINLPDPADLVFTPATLNGEPVACRITIKCSVDSKGHLDFE